MKQPLPPCYFAKDVKYKNDCKKRSVGNERKISLFGWEKGKVRDFNESNQYLLINIYLSKGVFTKPTRLEPTGFGPSGHQTWISP